MQSQIHRLWPYYCNPLEQQRITVHLWSYASHATPVKTTCKPVMINITMNNFMDASWGWNFKLLLGMGSSCCFSMDAPWSGIFRLLLGIRSSWCFSMDTPWSWIFKWPPYIKITKTKTNPIFITSYDYKIKEKELITLWNKRWGLACKPNTLYKGSICNHYTSIEFTNKHIHKIDIHIHSQHSQKGILGHNRACTHHIKQILKATCMLS